MTATERSSGRRRSGALTLAALARELNVSKATVSNAYNRPDQLSSDLRERILSEAARLGYRGPDPLASTFSRRKANAVGLVFDDPLTFALTDPAEVLFLTGLGAACEEAGVGLVLIPRGPADDLVHQALVDGFVCHCDLEGDNRVDLAIARGLPVVVVDGPQRDGIGHVGIDDRAAAEMAAQHLVELGHQRIAVIAAPLSADGVNGRADQARQNAARFFVTRQRLAGYRDAIERAGIAWASVIVEEGAPYGRESAYQATVRALDVPDRPTALLVTSDELAFGAYRAVSERGLRIPDDIAVVGFDDAPPAAWADPPLTTVRQPHWDKGYRAAQQLFGTDGLTTVELPTELIVRASTR